MTIRNRQGISLICDTTASGLDTGIDKWGEIIELNFDEWTQLKSFAGQSFGEKILKWRNGDWILKTQKLDKDFIVTCYRVKQIYKPEGNKILTITSNNKQKHYSILSRVTHSFTQVKGRYWWNVIGNPTSIKVGNNTRPIQFSSNVSTDILMQFSLPFESLLTFVGAPLKDLRDRIIEGAYTLHNVQFANYMKTTDKKIALRIYGIAYGLITINKDLEKRNLGGALGFSFTDYEGRNNYRTGFLLKDKYGDHNLISLNVYDKAEEGKYSGLTAFWNKLDKQIVDNNLRFDITLHKAYFPQLFTAAFGKTHNTRLKPCAANVAKAIAEIDSKEGFSSWLVRKILIKRFGFFSVWSILNEKEDILDKLEKIMSNTPKSKVDYTERFTLWKNSGSMTLKEAIEGTKGAKNSKLNPKSSYEILKRIQNECQLSPYLTAYYITALRAHSKMIGLSTEDYLNYYQAVEKGTNDSKISDILKNGKKEIQKAIKTEGNLIKMFLSNIETNNGLLYMQPREEKFQFNLNNRGKETQV